MHIPERAVAVAIALALNAFALEGTPVANQQPAPAQEPTPAQQPAAAQQPAPASQVPPAAIEVPKPDAQAQTPAPIRGELIQVDAEARTLSVLTSTGAKVQFAYTDTTEVSGAKEGIAGLAAMKNVRVVVHFKEDAKNSVKTATRIEVQPKQLEVEPSKY